MTKLFEDNATASTTTTATPKEVWSFVSHEQIMDVINAMTSADITAMAPWEQQGVVKIGAGTVKADQLSAKIADAEMSEAFVAFINKVVVVTTVDAKADLLAAIEKVANKQPLVVRVATKRVEYGNKIKVAIKTYKASVKDAKAAIKTANGETVKVKTPNI